MRHLISSLRFDTEPPLDKEIGGYEPPRTLMVHPVPSRTVCEGRFSGPVGSGSPPKALRTALRGSSLIDILPPIRGVQCFTQCSVLSPVRRTPSRTVMSGGAMDRQTTATGTALLRFAIIGPLLASPPPRGRLQAAIQTLSEQEWTTPDGRTRRFSAATIERWYYMAQRADADPMAALRRCRRSDAGHRRSVSDALLAAVREQDAIWPWRSVELHHRNLAARADGQPDLGPLPSPSTLRRVMREHDLVRRSRSGNDDHAASNRNRN